MVFGGIASSRASFSAGLFTSLRLHKRQAQKGQSRTWAHGAATIAVEQQTSCRQTNRIYITKHNIYEYAVRTAKGEPRASPRRSVTIVLRSNLVHWTAETPNDRIKYRQLLRSHKVSGSSFRRRQRCGSLVATQAQASTFSQITRQLLLRKAHAQILTGTVALSKNIVD